MLKGILDMCFFNDRARLSNAVFLLAIVALSLPVVGSSRVIAQERPVPGSVPQNRSEQVDTSFVLAQATFDSKIKPILRSACLSCHGEEDGEADINLEKYSTIQQVIDGRREWMAVLKAIRNMQMPPPQDVFLSTEKRTLLEKFIESVLYEIDCQQTESAGLVTIRRLSRYEYGNTIRDYLGVNFNDLSGFPADEVGYGFDNIGDVLSVSPIHMEKYLDAAEKISQMALFDPESLNKTVKWNGDQFEGSERTHTIGTERVITTTDSISIRHQFRHGGKYKLTVHASEDPGGDEPANMLVLLDDQEIGDFAMQTKLRRSRPYEIETTIEPGHHIIRLAFTNDFYNPNHPDAALRDRNLIIRSLRITGPLEIDMNSIPPLSNELSRLFREHKRSTTSEEFRQDLRGFIEKLASFGFRRPATQAEIERFVKIFDTELNSQIDASVFTAMQTVLQAILVSPHFLYRIEKPVEPGSLRALDPFELATSLSYFLWSSMPDPPLIRSAANNSLYDAKTLELQVRRMLADHRSRALVDNFATQWLQLRLLNDFEPSPEIFGEFDELLRNSMVQETKLLVEHVIQNDLPVSMLLNSPNSFVNRRLAIHYQLPEAIVDRMNDEKFEEIDISLFGRFGLLGHASILTLTSNPSRTSPVKRGKWVLENLLAQPPPPPAPEVPTLENQPQLTGTLRERMMQHSVNPACAVCHDQLDPIGFALEKFDAIGRFRQTDEGATIDDSGVMPDGQKFSGLSGLEKVMSNSKKKEFYKCVAEKLFVYGLGRGPEDFDDCLTNEIANAAMNGHDRFSDFVLAIVKSDAFRKRGVPTNNKEMP